MPRPATSQQENDFKIIGLQISLRLLCSTIRNKNASYSHEKIPNASAGVGGPSSNEGGGHLPSLTHLLKGHARHQ